ncbi:MAG: cytidylate kinase-like family protein [Candidatus Symbiothrix sp.]|jgi:cytidylate kinase|nr:cytidylate kinase-like family protein [Candidatus Symbiothrix sp.]
MNSIITIGRQLGSGGKLVGSLLAHDLNIPCYDKELILLAARESGLGKEFFEQADEKKNFLSSLSAWFSERPLFATGNYNNYLCNDTLFKIQSDVIRSLAEQGPCIFVGRCADYILRDHPRLLRIFITANLPDRIERLCKDQSVSEKEAILLIEQADRKRANYYNYYSNKVWGMATSYDLCINTSVFSINECLQFLKQFLGKWKGDE